jgi:preprotein translocase subunit SecD
VQPHDDRVLIKLSDVPDRERLKKIITAAGGLELVAVKSPSSPEPVRSYKTKKAAVASLGGTVPANRRVLPYAERDESTVSSQNTATSKKLIRWVVVESPAIVDVNEIREVFAVHGSAAADDYRIAFSLKPDGAEKLGNWTAANINKYLGVALNNEVKSIAAIRSQISDNGEITGRFTEQSAADIAQILNSGSLPAPVKIVYEGANKPKKGSQ